MTTVEALGTQCFTHVHEDGTQVTWASQRLGEFVETHPMLKEWTFRIPVEEFHAGYCVTERGVETHRLDRLLAHPEWMLRPLLFVAMPENRTLLLDGTHRYVLAYLAKIPELVGWIVPYEIAKDYIVVDAEHGTVEELMTGWSGV